MAKLHPLTRIHFLKSLHEMMAVDETSVVNLLLHEVSVPEEFKVFKGLKVHTREQGSVVTLHSIRMLDLLNYLLGDENAIGVRCDGTKPVGERYEFKRGEKL